MNWVLIALTSFVFVQFSYNHSILKVEWDTEPGVREIQSIQTSVNTGPNEIVTIQTTAKTIRYVLWSHYTVMAGVPLAFI